MSFPFFKKPPIFSLLSYALRSMVMNGGGARWLVSWYNKLDGIPYLSSKLGKVPHQPQSEVLTFYLPIFFTFQYLSSQDHEKIARILKFWCVLSLAYIIQFFLAFILAEYLSSHAATLTSWWMLSSTSHSSMITSSTVKSSMTPWSVPSTRTMRRPSTPSPRS